MRSAGDRLPAVRAIPLNSKAKDEFTSNELTKPLDKVIQQLIEPFVPWIRIKIGRLGFLLALFQIASRPVCCYLLSFRCTVDAGASGNCHDAEYRQYHGRSDRILVIA